MGTNFYVATKEGKQLFHLGKRCAGWVFLLHGYLDDYGSDDYKTIVSVRDAANYALDHDYIIVDECGEEYDPIGFVDIVCDWKSDKNFRRHEGYDYSVHASLQHREYYDVLYDVDFE